MSMLKLSVDLMILMFVEFTRIKNRFAFCYFILATCLKGDWISLYF